MTIDELITQLQAIKDESGKPGYDIEAGHGDVDQLLLDYINNEQVSQLFGSIPMWYA
jgi:hypothetical protein